MDTYQAIYDAVRSKISYVDGGAIADRIAREFDFSHHAELIKEEFLNAAFELQRPSVVFRPTLKRDGESWCALLGDDLQSGVAGFGGTPEQAMAAFDAAWCKPK